MDWDRPNGPKCYVDVLNKSIATINTTLQLLHISHKKRSWQILMIKKKNIFWSKWEKKKNNNVAYMVKRALLLLSENNGTIWNWHSYCIAKMW